MRLSAQAIRRCHIFNPCHERTKFLGMSYGLGPASYDVRIAQDMVLEADEFALASIIEHMELPNHISAQVADKSSWARQGLSLFNTFVDPGWKGYLTLELKNCSKHKLFIDKGMPIAQLIFDTLDQSTDIPYRGKYYDQPNKPIHTIWEKH